MSELSDLIRSAEFRPLKLAVVKYLESQDARIKELEEHLEEVKKVWAVSNSTFGAYFSTKEKAEEFASTCSLSSGTMVTEIDVF